MHIIECCAFNDGRRYGSAGDVFHTLGQELDADQVAKWIVMVECKGTCLPENAKHFCLRRSVELSGQRP
ncbi:hypothetical protein WN48_00179 [Eufriesea mexicana]|nr:hypothetical protein WN48_00179 [Eufriesea mexicana]